MTGKAVSADVTTMKYKVGLTWGCFDGKPGEGPHVGHLNLLKNAKAQCEFLIVCVSDDDYMVQIKGVPPMNSFLHRIKEVAKFPWVALVGAQTLEFGKKEAILRYKPDALFVGDDHLSDYTGEGLGVKVVYLPHTPGVSSTQFRKDLGLVV